MNLISEKAYEVCRTVNHTIVANMAEYIVIAHLAKTKLAPVAVSKQILKGMKAGPHETVCFPKVTTLASPSTPAVIDAALEDSTDERCRGVPPSILGGHIVLDANTGEL